MNIGELFVTLGVKGSDQTKKALTGVDQGLKDIKSSSLLAKAAIAATLYELGSMMSSVAKVGTGLNQFSQYTGLSAQELQKWQYAGKQAGISAEEVESSVKALQQAMIVFKATGQGPEGIRMFSQSIGGLDFSKLEEPFYMMQKLQEYAQKNKNPLANWVLSTFPITDKIVAGMRMDVFNDDNFKKAYIQSDAYNKSLTKVNANLTNIKDAWTRGVGNLAVQNLGKMLPDILKLEKAFFSLGEKLSLVAEKFKLIDLAGKSISGWASLLDRLASPDKYKSDTGFFEGVDLFFKGLRAEDQEKFEKMIKENQIKGGWLENIIPTVKPSQSNPQSSVEINQEVHFNSDVNDKTQVANDVKSASNYIVRQLSNQVV